MASAKPHPQVSTVRQTSTQTSVHQSTSSHIEQAEYANMII